MALKSRSTLRRSRVIKEGVSQSRLVLPAGEWPLLIDYLVERFNTLPREELLRRMQCGEIIGDKGELLLLNELFTPYRRIFYYRQVPSEKRIPFVESIVFEDEQILVADKPPFLTVLPAGKHLQETLLVRLRKSTGIDSLVPMHRIDRETSGLVMFTKVAATRGLYQSLFDAKAIEKIYEAIAPTSTRHTFPMRYQSRIEVSAAFMQMQEIDGAPNTCTVIECIETQGALSKYRINLETGKKHQIRIHFSSLGMPIVNDQIYPVLQPADSDDYAKPLKLLAKSISFTDPITRRRRYFESQRALII
jgi:tRNA pseudouridine32 synthase / 23S rRNA pseudouridine746 synthase